MRGVLLVLLAACGNVTAPHTPDASGGGDGRMPDGTVDPTVHLTVLTTDFSGLPDSGAIAVFVDPSNNVIHDGLVDAMGKAQAAMPMGGSVTVIRQSDPSMTERDYVVTTIVGVKPGDTLTVGKTASPRSFTGATTTMNAAFAPYSTNSSYELSTQCGTVGGTVSASGAGTAQLSFAPTCHGATFDLLSVASASSTDVRYVYQQNVPYGANGTVSVPNTWTTMNNFMVTLTNVPADISGISVFHAGYLGEQEVASEAASVATPTAGVDSATVPYAPVGTRARISAVLRNTNANGFQNLEVRTNTLGSTQGLDASQLQLPWIVGQATATVSGMTWDQIDQGTPDARIVTWFGHWADSTRTYYLSWQVEDGVDSGTFTLPALPASYAMYDPTKQTSVTVGFPSVVYIDDEALNGYDAARPYGPNLVDNLADLGVFVDQPVHRRLSRTPLLARQH